MRLTGCAMALLTCALMEARAADFVLVRDGRPAVNIVLAARCRPAAQFAAAELRDHVRRITGVELPVIADDEPVSGPRIIVGDSRAARAVGIDADRLMPQQYIIRFGDDWLALVGRDAARDPWTNVSAQLEPARAPGRFGRALSFAAGDNVVRVDQCGFDDAAGSLEAWVQIPGETASRQGTIFRLDSAAPWTYHIVQMVGGSHKISYVVYNGEVGRGVTSAELEPGWHHVLATHDLASATLELFIDGVSAGTAEYLGTTCADALLGIGGMPGGGTQVGNPFTGLIDEVRVSDVVRTPEGARARGPFAADEHTTVLLHCDEEDGLPRDASGRALSPSPPPMFEDQSTCYAVYQFLEDFCGVRWYGPGEIGMVCPSASELAVARRDIKRAPAMSYRQGYPPYPGGMARGLWGEPGTREMDTFWCRLRAGGAQYSANHSFYGYYDRFWEPNPDHPELFEQAHPDWFAQGYQGRPPQMCYSNPGFIRQVVADAREYFDTGRLRPGAHAMGDYFALVPMDNSSYCKCAQCRAQINQTELANQQFSNGQYSNYIWGFVNAVAREVRATHPDRYLAALAYSRYAYYPEGMTIEPNVAVQMCLHIRNWWAPDMARNDMRVYHSWIDRGEDRPYYLWLYYCFPEQLAARRDFNCFPGFFAHTAGRLIKRFAADGVRGAFLNGLGEQVDTWITFKLFDDPERDVDVLLDEFFTGYYGSAAAPMKRIYLLIEETFGNPANYPPDIQNSVKTEHQTEELAWGWLGTEERMAELGGLMRRAHELAATAMERRRVELFDRAVWQHMVEGRRAFLEKQAMAPMIERLRSQEPPAVDVPRLAEPAAGDPAAVDWAQAAVLEPWRTLQGMPAECDLDARVAHDGEYLYVRLSEVVETARLVSAPGIWSGDDWELFFADRRAEPYCQVGINPAGHSLCLPHGPMGGWSPDIRVISDTTAADRWTVQVAIPLAQMTPSGVAAGASFYANFFRAHAGQSSLLAWSPNFSAGFHEPSRLGRLTLK